MFAALQAYLEASPATYITASVLYGLVVGSFLNVVIHRLPLMLERSWKRQCREMLDGNTNEAAAEQPFNLVVPRSRCPHCDHPIKVMENIPIISFLWLRGKCSACGQAISPRYPFVEGLTALISALTVWHFGVSMAALGGLLLSWALITLAFIDYDHQILPDVITLPFLWLGLFVNAFGILTDLQSAVIGAITGYLSLWLIYHGFKLLTGKEGMGFGDFKLFALLGAWLGWQSLPLVILLASFTGAVIGISFIVASGRGRDHPIPFGPFLCLAGWIALLWGDTLTRAYLQFARL